ncbi:MAG: hypothetical protein FRX49_00204 [Trebouxia sp. A1-2]|nr:MAG: hypothetical protein FRX49_00204 [Trebouxia sp. A1-2]
MAMLGSPDMTVRAEKSTRLPIRLPLTRPDLPFRRWPIDSNGLPERCTKKSSVMIVCLEQIMLQLTITSMGSQPGVSRLGGTSDKVDGVFQILTVKQGSFKLLEICLWQNNQGLMA